MKYTRHHYPDGGIYAEIQDFANTRITERINNYEDLFFIKSLKDICDYNNIQDVELFIPCLFQQQHDRRFKDNQSFEGKLVAEFINSCNFKKVIVFHPHSDVIVGQINKCHIQDNSQFIEWVLRQISPLHGVFGDHNASNNLIMMSSDAGGFKPLIKLAEYIEWQGETYSASKSRDPKSHKLTQLVDRQDFGGKDILIIDDICQMGNTFIGLSEILKQRNCGKLYLAVSHMCLLNPSFKLNEAFDIIFTTNSKFNNGNYNLGNIKIMQMF